MSDVAFINQLKVKEVKVSVKALMFGNRQVSHGVWRQLVPRDLVVEHDPGDYSNINIVGWCNYCIPKECLDNPRKTPHLHYMWTLDDKRLFRGTLYENFDRYDEVADAKSKLEQTVVRVSNSLFIKDILDNYESWFKEEFEGEFEERVSNSWRHIKGRNNLGMDDSIKHYLIELRRYYDTIKDPAHYRISVPVSYKHIGEEGVKRYAERQYNETIEKLKSLEMSYSKFEQLKVEMEVAEKNYQHLRIKYQDLLQRIINAGQIVIALGGGPSGRYTSVPESAITD